MAAPAKATRSQPARPRYWPRLELPPFPWPYPCRRSSNRTRVMSSPFAFWFHVRHYRLKRLTEADVPGPGSLTPSPGRHSAQGSPGHHHDRGGAALERAMEDRLDIVAVGVERKRPVVPRVVVPLPGRAVVISTRKQCCAVEGLHRLAIRRLEGEMYLRDVAIGLVHEKLIGVKVSFSLLQDIRMAERFEYCPVEALAGLQIGHPQVDMVDEPALVEFHPLLLLALRASSRWRRNIETHEM